MDSFLIVIRIGTNRAVGACLLSVCSLCPWIMDCGLPILNCLLPRTLRNLCTTTCSDSSTSSKWVYSVFWRILPRNYPPPKWDHGANILDRAKGNKRNWILVWEDGFCDFYECERGGSEHVKGRFGADIFFKLSHEVYNFGEGLIGKVAADNGHKWVFRDSTNENDPSFVPSWNISIDPQPKAWDAHFNSGIQTIAIISVREGIIQLGSFDKVPEDLNTVISIQRKFSYLQSIPGIYALQRPCLQIQYPHTFRPNTPHSIIEANDTGYEVDDKRQLIGSKRLFCDRLDELPIKSMNLGYNSPHKGISRPAAALWAIPPLLPCTPFNTGPISSKLPSVSLSPSYNVMGTTHTTPLNKQNINCKTARQRVKVHDCSGLSEVQSRDVKAETSCTVEAAQEEKPVSLGHHLGLECRIEDLGFGPQPEGETSLNLS